jgi:hypothetical protein
MTTDSRTEPDDPMLKWLQLDPDRIAQRRGAVLGAGVPQSQAAGIDLSELADDPCRDPWIRRGVVRKGLRDVVNRNIPQLRDRVRGC